MDAHSPKPGIGPHGDVDQATLQAFHALGRLFHLHRQVVKRTLSNSRAHPGEHMCLRLLSGSDGMSQSDLAEILHLSRPRVTSILQGLEKTGAVRRQIDSQDQRISRVFLTADGRRRELQNRAAFQKYIEGTIGRLSEGDRRELTRLLEQVSDNMAELLSPGSDQPTVGDS